MRRQDRAATLLEKAEPWDLIVLDEAHHARRRAMGANREDRPNNLLRLMRALKERTQGLLLLTATPMQVHPIETWDLLDLLGLPAEWSEAAFLQFFEDLQSPNPSAQAMERLAYLFRSVERTFGEVAAEDVERITALSRLRTRKLLSALRDGATIPRRQLSASERQAAVLDLADAPDDETGEMLDVDELERLARDALVADEHSQIVGLLERSRALPPDSKLASLKAVLADLRERGYEQAMVFTHSGLPARSLAGRIGRPAALDVLFRPRRRSAVHRWPHLAADRARRGQAPLPRWRSGRPALHRCRRQKLSTVSRRVADRSHGA